MTSERKLYEVDKNRFPKERYRKHRRYIDDNGHEMPETYKVAEIPEDPQDMFYVVSPGEENALDLIASKEEVYNDEELWWVIAEANNIVDPLDVPVGTNLRIPNLRTLYRMRGILS